MSLSAVDPAKILAALPRASAGFLRLNGLQGETFAPTLKPQPADNWQPVVFFRTASGAPVAVPAPKGKRAVSPASPPKTKKPRAQLVPRTRNAGTLTEAAFWGMLRSGLRRTFRFWRPATNALKAAKTPCRGPHGQRFAYLCAGCNHLFPRKQVEIDHAVPCGTLRRYEDLAGFVARLTAETGFQVLCEACHLKKTAGERETRQA